METKLRYAGPAIMVLWLLEAVAVVCLALAALDSTGTSTAMSLVVRGLFEYYVAFGFIFAVAFMGIASHFSVFEGAETLRADGRSMGRLHAFILITALGVGLTAVSWLNWRADSESGIASWRFLALVLGVPTLALATHAMVRAVRRLPSALVRFSLRVFLGGAAIGTAAAVLSDYRVGFLQRGTLLAVDAIIRLIYSNATRDLAQNAVGTSLFRVRVFPGCSGVESMTLGALFMGVYLFLLRRYLRFPRALLLVPVLLLSLFMVNTGRIVAFIAIGQYASQKALNAFHSSIGWFAFALTIAVVIPSTESLLKLRIQGTEVVDGASPRNDAAPYLVPFIASLLVAAAISVLALDGTSFGYLRYGVAALAAYWFWDRLGGFRVPSGLGPILVGASVSALYVLASPPGSAPSSFTAAALDGSSPIKLGLFILGYTLVTPLIEELAFRGYLLRRIHSLAFLDVPFGSVGWRAVLISSLAFGAMHGLFVQATIAGLAFGIVARKTGGIRGAYVAHAVANGLLAAYAIFTHRLGVIG